MTFDQLATVFIAWGYYVRPEHYEGFMTYTANMLKKKRVMLIRSENGLDAIISSSLQTTTLSCIRNLAGLSQMTSRKVPKFT